MINCCAGLVQAWNELGESYSRKNDFINARICFEGALQHERYFFKIVNHITEKIYKSK